jgi:hypothetical protein
MRYLFIIISLIILIIILHIYLNMSEKTIENFSILSAVPFLGPIEFRDKDDENEVLGYYPENWRSETKNEDIQVSVVYIKKGEQGDRGEAGTPSGVGICDGIIDIESIDTNSLEINAKEIDMKADQINIKNRMCFDDDNCLDIELIKKINKINDCDSITYDLRNEIYYLTNTNTQLNAEILFLKLEKQNLEKQNLEKSDTINISSINKDTINQNLEISGHTLDFKGEVVNFANQFCIDNHCLTEEDFKKIKENPGGESGEPGICSDAI